MKKIVILIGLLLLYIPFVKFLVLKKNVSYYEDSIRIKHEMLQFAKLMNKEITLSPKDKEDIIRKYELKLSMIKDYRGVKVKIDPQYNLIVYPGFNMYFEYQLYLIVDNNSEFIYDDLAVNFMSLKEIGDINFYKNKAVSKSNSDIYKRHIQFKKHANDLIEMKRMAISMSEAINRNPNDIENIFEKYRQAGKLYFRIDEKLKIIAHPGSNNKFEYKSLDDFKNNKIDDFAINFITYEIFGKNAILN